jgi:flagellar basal body-associated protein FliL
VTCSSELCWTSAPLGTKGSMLTILLIVLLILLLTGGIGYSRRGRRL